MASETDYSYIQKKREMAGEAIDQAGGSLRMARTILQEIDSVDSVSYKADQVHEQLKEAETTIAGARRDLEKACWTAAGQVGGFDDWLRARGLPHLVWSED